MLAPISIAETTSSSSILTSMTTNVRRVRAAPLTERIRINNDNGVYWDATTGGGNVIANYVIENNVAQGLQLYSGTSGQPQNVTVEENTIANNQNWGIALSGQNNNIVNKILQNDGSGITTME